MKTDSPLHEEEKAAPSSDTELVNSRWRQKKKLRKKQKKNRLKRLRIKQLTDYEPRN
jgi:hypothetical protein